MKTTQIFKRGNETVSRCTNPISLIGLLPILLICLGWQSPASAATLTTDRSDYFPGMYVTFSGAGWQPGETVNIQVYETTVDPYYDEGGVFAVANANGNISNSDFIVQQSFLGQGFLAQAIGASSGLSATAAFTD